LFAIDNADTGVVLALPFCYLHWMYSFSPIDLLFAVVRWALKKLSNLILASNNLFGINEANTRLSEHMHK
jgi:hypothetical protein